MLDTHARKIVQPLFEKGGTLCIRFGLSPNTLTLISFFLGVSAGFLVFFELRVLAVSMLWLSGLFDVLDGTVARKTGKSSALGTVMDVTFDRIVELAVVLGVALRTPEIAIQLLVLTSAIIISMTVFLTVGAVADKSGVKSFYYQAGVAERTEGFIMFSLMMLLPSYAGWITMAFAAMILFTAGQRFVEAVRIFGDE
ncbi:MAG: CDP-alcohol phosphatidyltransferase family protein [Spirochaetaceae bacterium]|nr:MAG: CDP-alcohol phosphatidyltransferase family protein [Spirochaetaceae bacterium]